MRKLFYLLCLIPCLSWAQAEGVNSHVTVHVGENRLADLLTEEQQKGVSRLTITGTLEQADYDFLRGGTLEKLDTLDLQDAYIDTIPAGALDGMELYLRLPQNIEYIGDYSFSGECEVTGKFPFRGVYKGDVKPYFFAGKNNPELINIESDACSSVYSKDGEILYNINYYYTDSENLHIQDGTKIIHGAALRGDGFPLPYNLVLPESLDSIGDYAFSDIIPIIATGFSTKRDYSPGGGYNRGSVICEAKEPPAFGEIGKGEFLGSFSNLYVPIESIGKYKEARGWNLFQEISGLEYLADDIASTQSRQKTLVTDSPEYYILKFPLETKSISIYDAQGCTLSNRSIQKTELTLAKEGLPRPYAIIRVCYTNGTRETIKLKP